MLHCLLIRPELGVDITAVYCTTVANSPGSLCQDVLEKRLVITMHDRMKISLGGIDQSEMIAGKNPRAHYSTIEALVLLSVIAYCQL